MEIRLIAEGEEELCNEFYNRFHKNNRSIQQWKWEFALNIYREEPIPYAVIKDDGRIVGTQALIPIRMIDKEGIYWTAKSEETLIDPDYRGKGLLEKLYALLFDYARERGFINVWGITSAVKALDRVGFSIPCATKQVIIPFSSNIVRVMLEKDPEGKKESIKDRFRIEILRSACVLAQAASSLKFNLNNRRAKSDIDIRTMDIPDERTGELCRRFVRKWGGTTIYRDSEYMRWRIFENPHLKSVIKAVYHNDNLLGWVAFTLGDDGMGYLIDLMAEEGDSGIAGRDLVKALLIEGIIGARNMGACGLRGWRVNNHPFDKLISKIAKNLGFYIINKGDSAVLYNCNIETKCFSRNEFNDWFVSRIYTEGTQG